jgi:xanthine dehydrogenase accessory factor
MTSIFRKLAEMDEAGESVAICTVINTKGSTPRHEGSKMLVFANGRTMGSVGGGEVENRVIKEALDSLKDGKTRLSKHRMVDPASGDAGVCGGEVEVFIEPLQTPPYILIIGSGHVGKALAHLAKWLGFRVGISDDRVELCNKEFVPDADEYYPCSMNELPERVTISNQTYVVLCTRGTDVDIEGLPSFLRTDPAYLGIIGSKRRWAVTRKAMIIAGFSEERLNKIHSPIGLELKAETPEEISVSIMAEILMVRKNGAGKSMSHREA